MSAWHVILLTLSLGIEMKKRKESLGSINPNKMKLSIGHQTRESGCGVHSNKPKRQRTRQAVRDAVLKEW